MKTYTALYFFSLVVLIMAAYIVVYTTVFNMLYIAGILSLVGLILNMLAFLGILSIKKHSWKTKSMRTNIGERTSAM